MIYETTLAISNEQTHIPEAPHSQNSLPEIFEVDKFASCQPYLFTLSQFCSDGFEEENNYSTRPVASSLPVKGKWVANFISKAAKNLF